MRVSQAGRSLQLNLVASSPLRAADPRTKLFLSVAISLVVMLPLGRLTIFIAIYTLFLVWTHLLPAAIRQIWRLKWLLILLFLFDWWLISLPHAAIICLRIILLAGVFALLFATTTVRELQLALEKLGIPYRYAFSLGLAFQSLGLIDDELRAIREAQASRGALPELSSRKRLLKEMGNLVSLTVPAIVLTTKRAWAITEAAYARGFDSPKRISYHSLKFSSLDFLLMGGISLVLVLLYWI